MNGETNVHLVPDRKINGSFKGQAAQEWMKRKKD